jgi:phosphotransacetylase
MMTFEQLYQAVDDRRSPVPVAVAGGAEPTVLAAVRQAREWGWITPLLAGSKAEIEKTAEQCGIDLNGFTILDGEDAAAEAVAAVRRQQARLLMKGQISTPALLRAVLDPDSGLRTDRVICQVVLMAVRGRRFLLADTGICVQPTLEQKCDILRSAAAVAHALRVDSALGESAPVRVAVMAASEMATAAMPDTLDAAELQRRGEAGEFPGCVVQGPLSFDLAYAADAADRKRIHGPVVGAADVMLFPGLAAANLTVKAIMYTADCEFGGILCGAACPVVFMSRADSTRTRLHSLALALRMLSPLPC